jgi:hypothetical protein
VGLLLAVCAVTGLAAAACSAGRITQTDKMVSAAPGGSGDSEDRSVAVRDALITYQVGGYRTGSTAPLSVRLFNNLTDGTVRLTGVTATLDVEPSPTPTVTPTAPPPKPEPAPAIGEVRLCGSGPVPTGTPSPAPTPTESAVPATSAPPSPTPAVTKKNGATPSRPAAATKTPSTPSTTPAATASSAPSATASAGPSANPCDPRLSVAVPAQGFAALDPTSGPYLAILGLTVDLPPGASIRLDFSFDNGARVINRVPAPVAPPTVAPTRTPLTFGPEG